MCQVPWLETKLGSNNVHCRFRFSTKSLDPIYEWKNQDQSVWVHDYFQRKKKKIIQWTLVKKKEKEKTIETLDSWRQMMKEIFTC